MRRNFHLEGHTFGESKVSSNSKPINHLWHKIGRCSEGAIPLTRTKEDDRLRVGYIQNFGKNNQRSIPQPKHAKPSAEIKENMEELFLVKHFHLTQLCRFVY
jgi:hypothetical protein